MSKRELNIPLHSLSVLSLATGCRDGQDGAEPPSLPKFPPGALPCPEPPPWGDPKNLWRPVVPPQPNPAPARPLTCLNSLPRSRWRRQPRPAGHSPCPRSCSPSGCRSRRPPKPSRSCGWHRAALQQRGSCHRRGQGEAAWRLLAAPQSPRWRRSPPAAHPGGSLWQPRLPRRIKRGDKEGTRLRTGQEAATKLVPKVLWPRSLLGASELQGPRSPPWVPGSFPTFPVAMGTPKEEPGSLLDALPGLAEPRGGRRTRQPRAESPRPARGRIPGFPRARIQPRGERDIPGRSSPWSSSRHRRDGVEGLRLPGGTPELRRGSAEAARPPRRRAKRRFMRTPTRDWTAWRKPSGSWK